MGQMIAASPQDDSAHGDAAWDAICRSQAVIEFGLDGTILWANEPFLAAFGYALDDIRGCHHRIFCTPDFAATADYAAFWRKLATGAFDTGVYKRIGKGGREVWLRATYNPFFDADGKPTKIVKFAMDVTESIENRAQTQGQIAAIDRSQAVVEFDLQGQILHANENFLSTFGYAAADLVGRHHAMLCDAATTASAAYREFWARLARGDFHSGRYLRLARDGRKIWIQATYIRWRWSRR
jgi:methyl-accepting chemotaxis protein